MVGFEDIQVDMFLYPVKGRRITEPGRGWPEAKLSEVGLEECRGILELINAAGEQQGRFALVQSQFIKDKKNKIEEILVRPVAETVL